MIEGDSSLLHFHSVVREEERERDEIAERIRSNSKAIRDAVEGIPREQQVQPDPTENVEGGGNIINFPSTPRPIR